MPLELYETMETKRPIMNRLLKQEMILKKHIDEFNTNGYSILENVIPEDLQIKLIQAFNMLKEKEEGISREKGKETAFRGSASHRLRNVVSKGDVFMQSLNLEVLLIMVEKILGSGFQLFASAFNNVGPGEKQQRMHTDDILIPFPRPIPFPVVVNTIWALSDFTEENGATKIVPESHRFKDFPTPDCLSQTIPALMKKGSILVYHGSVWHGAGPNHSEADHRIGYILTFCSRFIRPYENQLKLMSYEKLNVMPLKTQKMLGFKYIVDRIKK